MINEVNLAPYFLFNLLEIMRNYLKRLGPFLSQKTMAQHLLRTHSNQPLCPNSNDGESGLSPHQQDAEEISLKEANQAEALQQKQLDTKKVISTLTNSSVEFRLADRPKPCPSPSKPISQAIRIFDFPTIYDSDGSEISQGDSDQIDRSRSAESWRG